jgi:hypothetical protein
MENPQIVTCRREREMAVLVLIYAVETNMAYRRMESKQETAV